MFEFDVCEWRRGELQSALDKRTINVFHLTSAGGVNNIDLLIALQCSAGKPRVLAFPLDAT